MKKSMICSFIGLDQTGLVKRLANVIRQNDGNWLESSMTKLAGHFAGIVRIDIDTDKLQQLQQDLEALKAEGLSVQLDIEQLASPTPNDANSVADQGHQSQGSMTLSVIGNDRPGIVYEVTQALATAHINVVNMQTHLSSAPMSGDSLFHSSMTLAQQQDHDLESLEQQLDAIANRLSIEIDLERESD